MPHASKSPAMNLKMLNPPQRSGKKQQQQLPGTLRQGFHFYFEDMRHLAPLHLRAPRDATDSSTKRQVTDPVLAAIWSVVPMQSLEESVALQFTSQFGSCDSC